MDLGLGQVSSLEGDGKSRGEVSSGWRLKRNLIRKGGRGGVAVATPGKEHNKINKDARGKGWKTQQKQQHREGINRDQKLEGKRPMKEEKA